MFVCVPRARFMSIVQVFSVFSVSLWQNYSATYWSGMYTTWFCGFVWTQIFLETRKKKDRIGVSSVSVWTGP